jgi:hypothetical protein
MAQFCIAYNNVPVTINQHKLLHLSEHIKKFGPPKTYSVRSSSFVCFLLKNDSVNNKLTELCVCVCVHLDIPIRESSVQNQSVDS